MVELNARDKAKIGRNESIMKLGRVELRDAVDFHKEQR